MHFVTCRLQCRDEFPPIISMTAGFYSRHVFDNENFCRRAAAISAETVINLFLGSLKFLLPAMEKPWQGGPASKTSIP